MLQLHYPPARVPLQITVLQEELDLIKRLNAALKAELAALETSQVDQLNEIVRERAKLIGQLQLASRRRAQAFVDAGIGRDAAAVEQRLATDASLAAQRQPWMTLRSEYRQLAERNRASESFVERQLRYVQNRWNGLLQSTGNAGVYASDGAHPYGLRTSQFRIAA